MSSGTVSDNWQRLLENPWLGFAVRRLVSLVGVLVVLTFAVFVMVHAIPGDPVVQALGLDADPALVAQIRAANGFDQGLPQQFADYVAGLLQGDMGTSFLSMQPVSEIISRRVGVTLELAVSATVLVLAVGVPLGMVVGALTNEGRHRKLDVVFTGVTSVGSAIPDFLGGTILVFFLAVQFRVLPVAGSGSLEQLVLPAVALALAPTMAIARIVRIETLDVLSNDYVRTARSKRLPAPYVYVRHVLPNSLTAALTVGGLLFAGIVGGAVAVEVVFARPGLGGEIVAAVVSKDYRVVQGITLALGFLVVIVNALIDVTLGVIDPRSLTREA